MKTTINGREFSAEVRAEEAAVDVLRERCDLTGTKLVCGSGVCGACTVLVDGTPMASCLLPAHSLEGRQVQTIEQYGEHNLHPMQRAFMATDGLQCGFCTPGFIMESIAFYERWREQKGTEEPSREEVAEALAGHLCRCGAYAGIYEAVQQACAGKFDQMDEIVAQRVDALPKVTGQARYTVDIKYEGQLVGKILRATYAHAEVIRLNLEPARAIEGVHAVIEMLDDSRKIRHVGQEIAAVAAVDAETAYRALAAIEVELKKLPLTIGIDAARQKGGALVWPEKKKKDLPNAAEGPILPGRWDENVREPRFGVFNIQPKKALRALEAARENKTPLVEGVWRVPAQIHTTLEPHCAVARWNDDGSLTVHKSSQACYHVAHQLAKRYKLSPRQVEVRCEYVGGGFGSKLSPTAETYAAIELAREAGAPVAVINTRTEEMTVGGYRPSADVELALAISPDGEWQGLQANAYADSGTGINSIITLQMGSTYTKGKQPRSIADIDVVTHIAPGKPFRGPGGPAASFALEGAIDQLAHDLGKDPVQLRRDWDEHEIRGKVFDWIDANPAWRERVPVGSQAGRFRRGIGAAVGYWSYFYDPLSSVTVEVTPDGIFVRTASQDMGNGTYTLLARAVAEVFQVSPLAVQVELGSSRAVHGPTAGGSRSANSLFDPTQTAARRVRDAFVKAAKKAWKVNAVEEVAGGLQAEGQTKTWTELAAAFGSQKNTEKRGSDRLIESLSQPLLRSMGMDIVIGKGNSAGAYITELEVDMLLGKIRPLRVWGVMGVGRIYVPDLARSQCYGGIIQGIGYALYEEKVVDPNTGAVVTANLEDYRIPGIAETPEMQIDFIEVGFEHARGEGVGLAELCTLPVAASVANAVFHATGWRPMQAPITPERLLKGVSAR